MYDLNRPPLVKKKRKNITGSSCIPKKCTKGIIPTWYKRQPHSNSPVYASQVH